MYATVMVPGSSPPYFHSLKKYLMILGSLAVHRQSEMAPIAQCQAFYFLPQVPFFWRYFPHFDLRYGCNTYG